MKFLPATRRDWLRALTRLACVAGALVLLLLLGVWMFEDRLIYFPVKHPAGYWDVVDMWPREDHVGPRIADCEFTAADGVKLHGWFCSPQRTSNGRLEALPASMTLLWFHGNAGNVTHRYDMIRDLMALRINILIIDYRGFGKSQGKPSEQGVYLDAQAAWKYLTTEQRVPPQRIVLFGKSLGGAVAIDLAMHLEQQGVRPAGLIVQSSFTSIPDVAETLVPLLPRVVMRTKMDSGAKIGAVHCPKLFIHSPADEVIPYRLGRRLYERAPEPKTFYEVPHAGHNETWLAGGAAYIEALRTFLEEVQPAARDGSPGQGDGA